MNDLKYPKNERVWTSYYSADHILRFILTSKLESREWYYLYELVDGVFKKLGKGRTPPELEEKYSVHQKLRSLAGKT